MLSDTPYYFQLGMRQYRQWGHWLEDHGGEQSKVKMPWTFSLQHVTEFHIRHGWDQSAGPQSWQKLSRHKSRSSRGAFFISTSNKCQDQGANIICPQLLRLKIRGSWYFPRFHLIKLPPRNELCSSNSTKCRAILIFLRSRSASSIHLTHGGPY